MRLLLLFILLAHLFLLSSCKKYQPADPSFFVRTNGVTVSTTSHEGSGSHKITDLFWYVNGKYQGTYPVGNLMPVISHDQGVRINVFAGIKNNGISDTRIPYPFFDFLTYDTLVESGKTIVKNFAFKYKAATTFTWNENFESLSGQSVINDTQYDGSIAKVTGADSFEKTSLKFTLPGGENAGRLLSSSTYTLPPSTGNVFLEIDYKCDTDFTVGLLGTDGIECPAVTVVKQENWNKIYIQLSTAVNLLATSKSNVYFKIVGDNSGQAKQVFLDNIKLLYIE